jgi:3-hydroxybutyryl-CoA dehydrogenase
VWLRKEIDGFIANRILRVISSEALYLIQEGVATPEEIDIAAENGLNYPMGPFRLMDLTGVDLAYLSAKRFYEETGFKKPGYDVLEAKYKAHEWGRKSGKGWYDYTK